MRARRQPIACLVAAFLLWPALWALVGAQTPGSSETPGKRAGNAVDYDGVLRLLEQKTDEKEILRRLADSPTTFTLSPEQVATLKDKGATPAILLAMLRASGQSINSDVRNFGIILDCSGSMLDPLPDGQTKIAVAKKVVSNFIRRIPNGKNLTFVVYGLSPREKRCDDVEVVQPLAPVTDAMKARLEKYIQDIVPLGFTPLANSMKIVGRELAKKEGISMLVVITDGMETCKGDPGLEAEKLTKALILPGGVDMIGLGVPPEEMKALRTLAKRGTFRLHETDQAKELERLLQMAKERAQAEAARRAKLERDRLAQLERDRREREANAKKGSGERDKLARDAADHARKAKEAADEAQQSADRARKAAAKAAAAAPAAQTAGDAAARARKAADEARAAAQEAAAAKKLNGARAAVAAAALHQREAEDAAAEASTAAAHAESEVQDAAQAERLKRLYKIKGVRPGPVEVALLWENKNDLDLHVIEPSGEEIFYAHRTSRSGGHLDVDMNVTYRTASNRPVEHIVWQKAPPGTYKVFVHFFRNHGKPDTRDPTYYKVRVKVRKKVTWFSGELTFNNPRQRKVLVTTFVVARKAKKGPPTPEGAGDRAERAKLEQSAAGHAKMAREAADEAQQSAARARKAAAKAAEAAPAAKRANGAAARARTAADEARAAADEAGTAPKLDQARAAVKTAADRQRVAEEAAQEASTAALRAQLAVEDANAAATLDDTIKRKGGKAGPVEVALMWFNKNDLDLHVIDPSGEEIFYAHRKARSGGTLDVDMNPNYATASMRPVEHVVWQKAPPGTYKVYVHFFNNPRKADTKDPTYYKVRVKVRKKVTWFSGELNFNNPKDRKVLVTTFVVAGKRKKGAALGGPGRGLLPGATATAGILPLFGGKPDALWKVKPPPALVRRGPA